MESAAIIDKLKKLLRLAQSSNQHEAELAMQRAMEIAANHRIDLDSINPNDADNQVTHDHTQAWSKMPLEAMLAARIVDAFFGVRCILRSGNGWQRVVIIGRSSEVEIGLYVFSFLVGHFRRCWNKRENKRLKRRDAFMEGMFEGLFFKLMLARGRVKNTSTSLVNRYDDYVAQHLGIVTSQKRYRSKSSTASSARRSGFVEGANTNIHPAVHSAKTSSGVLLQ